MIFFPHTENRRCISFWLAAITLLILLASCGQQIPHIDSIDPKIGRAGETVTIQGRNFGRERDESYVTLAGVSPTNSSYLNWHHDSITLRIPELGDAGLIYVHVKGKKSNGVLFSNQASLPRPAQGAELNLIPQIVSISPQSAPIGSVITITGINFGSSRERSAVLFNWEGGQYLSIPPEARTAEFIEVSETEFGYELWSEREIRIRIPDGAVRGNMEIRTFRGNSRPFIFNVSGKPGTKIFGDKHSYTINYSVNIKVIEASGSNTLYLWIPQPSVSAAQRNIELLSRSSEPFVENYRGVNLYKLSNLTSNSDTYINLSYKVDVYAIETNIRSQSVRQEEDSAVRAAYTQADTLVPSDDLRIKAHAQILSDRNPFVTAQRIYKWLISEYDIRGGADSTDYAAGASAVEYRNSPLEALASKQADPFTAALLFCALGRASGLPCIPISGVLVNRNRQTIKHYWAEFWIDGLGWIPVDPGQGAKAVPPAFQFRQDSESYYFGNADSQRITFSRGQLSLSQMDQRGRVSGSTRSYSLQNLREEAVGGLDAYSSLWGDITVTGIY